jgi:glycosyltransferase involved in cell wall biosynthesis
VVDDGSTDNTAEVLEDWGRAHSGDPKFELRTFRQDNSGCPAARNHGLIECRGEYVQMLDSDDFLDCGKIGLQVLVLSSQTSKTVVYGPCQTFRQVGGRYEACGCELRDNRDPVRDWLKGGFAVAHTLLWRRSDMLAQGPWDESLARADDDTEYGVRFLIGGGHFIPCQGSWAYLRVHSGRSDRITASNARESLETRIRVAERVEQELTDSHMMNRQYRVALAHRYYDISRRAANAHPDLARSCLRNMRRLVPWSRITIGTIYSSLSWVFGLKATEAFFRLLALRHVFKAWFLSPRSIPLSGASSDLGRRKSAEACPPRPRGNE